MDSITAASNVLAAPFKLIESEEGGRGDTGRDVVLLLALSNGVPAWFGVPGLYKDERCDGRTVHTNRAEGS